MSSVLDQLNKNYAGKLVAEKIDLSEHPEVGQEYKVRYVPHLLFINAEGKVVEQKVGYMSETEVIKTFKDSGVSFK